MNFANVKAITIPEGNVKQITDGQGAVLWKKKDSIILPKSMYVTCYPINEKIRYYPGGTTSLKPISGDTIIAKNYTLNDSDMNWSSYSMSPVTTPTNTHINFQVHIPSVYASTGAYGKKPYVYESFSLKGDGEKPLKISLTGNSNANYRKIIIVKGDGSRITLVTSYQYYEYQTIYLTHIDSLYQSSNGANIIIEYGYYAASTSTSPSWGVGNFDITHDFEIVDNVPSGATAYDCSTL